jgi:hypothetical protein
LQYQVMVGTPSTLLSSYDRICKFGRKTHF